MNILDSLAKRRTYYAINDALPVSEQQVVSAVEQLTALVPDAFNMKSARAVVLFDGRHRQLWDLVYDVFGGKVAHEKLDGFRAGAGTVLYFYDNAVVSGLQAQFPLYAANFPVWAQQANGMLQLAVWSGLRELGVGASLQHYNPVIDDAVKKAFSLPESWQLVAEMPFGGIAAEPDAKAGEDISARVRVIR